MDGAMNPDAEIRKENDTFPQITTFLHSNDNKNSKSPASG